MQKNVIISWSSGKDSTLTLERLMDNEQYNVVGLYTTYVKDEVPFQATPLYVLDMQAELLDLPLIKIELPESFPPNEIYQDTIIRGLKQSNLSIDAVAFGDMFCNGIEAYRRSYIEPAGWECVFPLLGQSSRDLADEIIAREIQTLVVTTDSSRLASQYCGKWYSEAFIRSLPDGVDPCGENGEFHTLVTDTRSYSGRIDIETTYIEEGERFCYQRYTAKRLPNT
ncbi:adenine nucleotide alpha hydrolase [Vibrio sp. Hep-1b-8]|uniref:adenine nucleotide alpha hydrolase n=1 Tax=unclassified Vibrio TaxID=2614977 RepID=UPI00111024A0|nr:adenine nucleotide alpha hydrolase [Vibrio sp. Hep-1b-8]TMX44216.1 ATPase [Vibrio sp. Hep-1b-8]